MKISLLYDNRDDESEELRALMKELAAFLTEERWQMRHTASLKQTKEFFRENPLLDALLYDVSGAGAVDYLCRLRQDYQAMQLMIIADAQMSPLDYIRPGILASSLLLRPWSTQQAKEILSEFIQNCVRETDRKGSRQSYRIVSREGITSIPYRQIYFFEAREKRVYLCAGNEEFGFRHTIEELAGELPSQFVRCHRSYIVNADKIRKVDLARNMICLERGFCVPFARRYKEMLKEYVKNGGD